MEKQKFYKLGLLDTRVSSNESDNFKKDGIPTMVFTMVFSTAEDAEEFRLNILEDWTAVNDEFAYFEDDSGQTCLTNRIENDEGFYTLTIEEVGENEYNEESAKVPRYLIAGTEIAVVGNLTIGDISKRYKIPNTVHLEFSKNLARSCYVVDINLDGKWIAALPINSFYLNANETTLVDTVTYYSVCRLYENIEYLILERGERRNG